MAKKSKPRPAADAAPAAQVQPDPDVLRERLRDVWDRHVSGKQRLPRPAAEFVGEVVDGETKLIGKALDKALDILESRSNGKAAPQRRPSQEPVEAVNLPVDQIVVSPFQVRQDFPEEEIRSLAESIKNQGQIMPIVVRRVASGLVPGRSHYELVDGERRWRAVLFLGWETIRAEVQPHSDAQARAIVLASALQRKDLNAIERARAMRQAIDAGDAKGPTELARQLGLAQGTVSNLLRLLDLPEAWQQRLISGEISERVGRAVAAWKSYPLIMHRIDRMTQGEGSQGPGYERFGTGHPWNFAEQTVEEFEEEIIRVAVEDCTRPMDGPRKDRRYYDAIRKKDVEIFEPSADQERELRIVTYNNERRATNVELWERLQNAFLDAKKYGAADCDDPAPAAKPAKKKATKADAKEQARQYAWRLYEFQLDWLCWLIADQLRQRASQSEVMALLAFGLATKELGWLDFDAELEHVGIKRRRAKADQPVGKHFVLGLVALMQKPVGPSSFRVASGVAAQLFWDDEGSRRDKFENIEIEEIAKALGIDLAEAFDAEQCGPLSARYWELHTAEQLEALGRQLGVTDKLPPAAKKADLVKAFLSLMQPDQSHECLPLPKELAKVRRPK